MKLYLSSYKLGDKTDKLKELATTGKIGYIPNALDFSTADPERRKVHIENDMQSLTNVGLKCELIDLRDYFNDKDRLKKKLQDLKAIFISGGNVFVLRQAMKQSGLDEILIDMKSDNSFLYAGYSAAGCVLSEKLEAYQIVDDATDTPYTGLNDVIWEGLGFLDYILLPHYDSNHPESDDISKELEYCKQKNLKYKTLRDGEVIIIEMLGS